mmetsp:Transcript_1344/g.5765  ORF Transcript_1344/g.5765 Transcript_1344/m.5765 type:complete len:216 (-) Transcript_1344:657-1304(-)
MQQAAQPRNAVKLDADFRIVLLQLVRVSILDGGEVRRGPAGRRSSMRTSFFISWFHEEANERAVGKTTSVLLPEILALLRLLALQMPQTGWYAHTHLNTSLINVIVEHPDGPKDRGTGIAEGFIQFLPGISNWADEVFPQEAKMILQIRVHAACLWERGQVWTVRSCDLVHGRRDHDAPEVFVIVAVPVKSTLRGDVVGVTPHNAAKSAKVILGG